LPDLEPNTEEKLLLKSRKVEQDREGTKGEGLDQVEESEHSQVIFRRQAAYL
jgi:hypothetical protein